MRIHVPAVSIITLIALLLFASGLARPAPGKALQQDPGRLSPARAQEFPGESGPAAPQPEPAGRVANDARPDAAGATVGACGDWCFDLSDLNSDCRTNLLDLYPFSEYWGANDCMAPGWCGGADVNQDGTVDLTDVSVLHYGWLACTDPQGPDCRQACPLQCGQEETLVLTADALPLTRTASACEQGDDYQSLCMGSYGAEEDIVYELLVLEPLYVKIVVENSVLANMAVALFANSCPGDDCVVLATGRRAIIWYVPLGPGRYSLLIEQEDACDDLGNPVTFELEISATYFKCQLPCPADATFSENEGPYDFGYVDTINGGCNSDPPVFQSVEDGEVICGTAGTFLASPNINTRDTDWYAIDLQEPSRVSWSVTSEFNPLIHIIGGGDCEQNLIIISEQRTNCVTASVVSPCLWPGTYWLWVAPSTFSGTFDGARYIGAVECETCTPPCLEAPLIEELPAVVPGDNTGLPGDVTPSCRGIERMYHTAWYRVIGTGEFLRASTCDGADFDTVIKVLEGTCDNLACVAADDDGCDPQSETFWLSTLGVTYYVVVGGAGDGDMGPFLLTVEPAETPIENDTCDQATPLTLPADVRGDTTYATTDQTPECGEVESTAQPAKSVWYQVTGADAILTADTCLGTDFDTVIKVFRGECDNLVCVAANDDDCDLQSEVSWCGEQGVVYYITLGGYDEGQAGEFRLRVEEGDFCGGDFADTCAEAIELTDGFVMVSTNGATTDAMPGCQTYRNPSKNVWYYADGNGQTFTASTCYPETSFDTIIQVYEGDCGNLLCVTGNDDYTGCGVQSQVSWCSEPGVRYYITVGAYSTTTGGAVKLSLDTLGGACTP